MDETIGERVPVGHPPGPSRLDRLVEELRGGDPGSLLVLDALLRRLRRDGEVHGAPTASATLTAAAQVIGDLGPRTPLLVEAAYTAAESGEPEAAWLADAALAAATSAAERADARLCLLWLANWHGDIVHAAGLADAESEAVVADDPRRAARLLVEVATSWLHAGHFDVAEDVAHRAVEVSRPWDDLHDAAVLGLEWARYGRGDGAAGARIAASDLRPVARRAVGASAFVGMLLVSSDRFVEARQALAVTEAAVRPTHPAALPFVLGCRADLDFRTGAWASGRAAAIEGAELARELGCRNMLGPILVQLARFDAAEGATDACLGRLEEAEAIAAAAGMLALSGPAAAVRGLLALGAGDPERASAHLLEARTMRRRACLVHPGLDPMAADLVEALVRAGRIEEARASVDELDEVGRRLGHDSSAVWVARGRMLLGTVDDATTTIATTGTTATAMPFDQARSLLVLGEHRRRCGERAAARIELTQAHRTFEHLGARVWAARALVELRAAGGRPPETGTGRGAMPSTDPTAQLTAQEREVARVVAGGATNAEAAAALYLSTKSIERHLTAVYRKLTLRSRTELARLVFDADPTAGDGGGPGEDAGTGPGG